MSSREMTMYRWDKSSMEKCSVHGNSLPEPTFQGFIATTASRPR
jgi:hypothetical protein